MIRSHEVAHEQVGPINLSLLAADNRWSQDRCSDYDVDRRWSSWSNVAVVGEACGKDIPEAGQAPTSPSDSEVSVKLVDFDTVEEFVPATPKRTKELNAFLTEMGDREGLEAGSPPLVASALQKEELNAFLMEMGYPEALLRNHSALFEAAWQAMDQADMAAGPDLMAGLEALDEADLEHVRSAHELLRHKRYVDFLKACLYQFGTLPFRADFNLKIGDDEIRACRHQCENVEGPQVIAIFLPGVRGGIGPCRQPGVETDDDALFPLLARRLASSSRVDSYRCSWSHMQPSLEYAVGGTCQVIWRALRKAAKRFENHDVQPPEEIRLVFVGHSLGARVALHAAEVMARHFAPDGAGKKVSTVKGMRKTRVSVAGVCTLNGATQSSVDGKFSALKQTRGLMVYGTADEVIRPQATLSLYEAFPSEEKRCLSIPDGTHDLYAHKDQLVEELSGFVLEAIP